MNKKQRKKKRRLTYGPNNARHVIWARFHCCTFFCYLVAKPKIQIKDQLAKKNEQNKKNMYLLWQCCSRHNVCNYVLSSGLRKRLSQHYTYRIYYLKFTKPLGEVVFIAVSPAQWLWGGLCCKAGILSRSEQIYCQIQVQPNSEQNLIRIRAELNIG